MKGKCVFVAVVRRSKEIFEDDPAKEVSRMAVAISGDGVHVADFHFRRHDRELQSAPDRRVDASLPAPPATSQSKRGLSA